MNFNRYIFGFLFYVLMQAQSIAIQLPPEPAAPTSQQQCLQLDRAYGDLLRAHVWNVDCTYGRIIVGDTPACRAKRQSGFEACLPKQNLECELKTARDNAVKNCRKTVDLYLERQKEQKKQQEMLVKRNNTNTNSPEQFNEFVLPGNNYPGFKTITNNSEMNYAAGGMLRQMARKWMPGYSDFRKWQRRVGSVSAINRLYSGKQAWQSDYKDIVNLIDNLNKERRGHHLSKAITSVGLRFIAKHHQDALEKMEQAFLDFDRSEKIRQTKIAQQRKTARNTYSQPATRYTPVTPNYNTYSADNEWERKQREREEQMEYERQREEERREKREREERLRATMEQTQEIIRRAAEQRAWQEQQRRAQEQQRRYNGYPGVTCFAAGTMVLMADQSYKPIDEIRPGDYVMSLPEQNTIGSKAVPKKVISVLNSENIAVFKAGGLIVTEKHPFLGISGKWEQLRNIKQAYTMDGIFKPISITESLGKRQVYNLEIEDYHTYIVKGNEHWVVHNAGGFFIAQRGVT